MADAIDVWRAGRRESICFAADIYSPDFVGFCARYTQSGNPLFIPETRGDMEAKAIYAFGRHDAIGLSLMGVERSPTPEPDMIRGFDLIDSWRP